MTLVPNREGREGRGGREGPRTDLDLAGVPEPDRTAEPEGFLVTVDEAERIHFLDWGGPAGNGPAVLMIHGLAQTAWSWTPVARRLRAERHVVAMDLRGHGLSDAPTHGYDPTTLAADAIAVAEGAGLLGEDGAHIVLAGHGFGAIVAAWAAAVLGSACAGLVLVDGGIEDLRVSTGMDPAEFMATIEEPPEVYRSMGAFLADRAGFDQATWDADQERAARATIVEVPAGKVVPATRPHAMAGSVEAMFDYDPRDELAAVPAPIVLLLAADDEEGTRRRALAALQRDREAAGLPPIAVLDLPADGHNLMRYRPVEVAAAILGIAARRSAAAG